jgi:hypothetical protein
MPITVYHELCKEPAAHRREPIRYSTEFLPGATKSPPGLGATNLLLVLLLLLLTRTI